ncbi:MAG TPA: TonB-dependent receptor [Bacteroidales bacterium]|nr:TonB-dependent receptor [Bacteroidales bacterium]
MKTFVLAVTLYCICSTLSAQEPNDSVEAQRLEEVIVTATKTSVSRNNVGYTVSVVKQENIEQSSESALLPVLSENVPGLFVTERGVTGFGVATGSAGQITIRGVGGNPSTQVLVLLNGNPQFMGLMGHPLPDSYIASDAQRVEVIRGPASTLYGSNAMGGVINIITKDQKKKGLNLNSSIIYGSYNTLKYMLNGGFSKDRLNVFASFNHDRTDGHRDSSDFMINNGYIRAGYELSKNLNINADFSLVHYKASDPGSEFSIAGERIDILRGMGALSLDNKFKSTTGSFRFFYNFGVHDISDGYHSDDNNYGWIAYQSFHLIKGNTLTFGIDGKTYGGRARQESKVIGDTSVWELGSYAFIQQELFGRLNINGGFRLEHHSVYGNEPVPSLGFAWRVSSTSTIKASVAKGFRSPTIRELYLFPPANEGLKPERLVNVEIGILQRFLNNRFEVELTAFKVEGSNMIKTMVNSGKPLNVNTGSFSNVGVELACKWQIIPDLFFTGNYSFIDMKKPVIATPGIQASNSLFYKAGNFDLSLSSQNIVNLYTQIEPDVKEDYMLLNSRVAWNITKNYTTFIKFENLLDQNYYINYGYRMPGFLVFAGINLHI